jgi:biotin carboxyl carrier protein
MTQQLVSETALTDFPDRIVVSPGHGRLRLCGAQGYTPAGEAVRAGEVIAIIEAPTESFEVKAPVDGWVMAFLAREGDRVRPGAPLVHLRGL